MSTKKVISLEQLQMLAQRVKTENEKITALIGEIDVPTNVSDLVNDSKFQTDSDVAAAIAKSNHLQYKIVQSVEDIHPETDGADKYIYLVKRDDGSAQDNYDEYMVIEQQAEKIGDWAVDLSDYVQKNNDDRLMTQAEGTKLATIKDGANKVEKGTGNGQIKIDGEDTDIYTLPEDVLHESDIADDDSVTSMLDEVFSPSD